MCVTVHSRSTWGSQKRAPYPLPPGIPISCEPPCDFWDLNPRPLQKQHVLLTTEPPLLPSPRTVYSKEMLRLYTGGAQSSVKCYEGAWREDTTSSDINRNNSHPHLHPHPYSTPPLQKKAHRPNVISTGQKTELTELTRRDPYADFAAALHREVGPLFTAPRVLKSLLCMCLFPTLPSIRQ